MRRSDPLLPLSPQQTQASRRMEHCHHRCNWARHFHLFTTRCINRYVQNRHRDDSSPTLQSPYSNLRLFSPTAAITSQIQSDVHYLPPMSSEKSCAVREIQQRSITTPLARSSRPSTLVIYNYYSSDGANGNLEFFLKHGLHSRPDTHFLLVLSAVPCVPIPEQANLGILILPSSCYGYGAIYEAITYLELAETYDHFIVLGSWVRGPFMPTWTDACWTDSFTRHLSIPQVHMSGTTHSCYDPSGRFRPHLHPTAWAFKGSSVLNILKPFACNSKKEEISQTLQISNVMMAHIRGWNVAALVPGWRNYSASDKCIAGPSFKPHPYETIFVNSRLSDHLKMMPRTSEDLTQTASYLQLATTASTLRGYDSNVVCR